MKKYWLLILVLLLVVRFFVSTLSYNNDMNNHFAWVQSIKTDGLDGFYERDFSPFAQANYPPLITETFFLSQKLSDSLHLENQKLSFALYKVPAVATETAAIILLGVCFSPLLLVVLLVNPGIFYNTLLWGQTEGLVAAFVVFSIYFIFKRKLYLSWIMFSIALLFKQSAIIFFPFLLLVSIKQFDYKKVIMPVLLSFTLFAVCFIPFYPHNFLTGSIKFLINDSQGQQFLSSVNALNFWFLIGKNNISDLNTFIGLNYRLIGMAITGIFYVYILYLAIKTKLDFKKSLILAGFINFAVFLFMTRIHERHLMPTLILLSPIILEGYLEFLLYGLISLIGFYNMYLIWNERFRFTAFAPLATLSFLMVAGFAVLLYLFSKRALTKPTN